MEFINIFGILLIAMQPSANEGQVILVDDDGFYPSRINVQAGDLVKLRFVFDEDEIDKGLNIPLFGIQYQYQDPLREVEFIPYQDFSIVTQRYNGALMGYIEVNVQQSNL